MKNVRAKALLGALVMQRYAALDLKKKQDSLSDAELAHFGLKKTRFTKAEETEYTNIHKAMASLPEEYPVATCISISNIGRLLTGEPYTEPFVSKKEEKEVITNARKWHQKEGQRRERGE